MSFLLLSIILSSIIGIIIIAWIRSFDIYEKETFNAMLLAFFVGGTSSVVIAIGIYQFLELFGIDNNAISTATGSFLVIGPVEEFAKLIGLIIVYSLIRRQFNELTDGIIYMSCVALGFSIIENFFYANAGENSQYLLVYRAFISTPAHISFSVLIGYSWYRHKREGKSLLMVILALMVILELFLDRGAKRWRSCHRGSRSLQSRHLLVYCHRFFFHSPGRHPHAHGPIYDLPLL